MDSPGEWHVAGTYYETCNCDAVCPCRRHNGRPGGRSIYGVCQFLLTWYVLEGHADSIDLSGRKIAMAGFYNDDEQGKPWRVILYVDQEAGGPAHAALEAIFLGRAAGDLLFTSNIAEVIAVRSAAIDFDHRKGKKSSSSKISHGPKSSVAPIMKARSLAASQVTTIPERNPSRAQR